jgi:hypothetical protein
VVTATRKSDARAPRIADGGASLPSEITATATPNATSRPPPGGLEDLVIELNSGI